MTKPKILMMSDHSSLHTGFATVSRNIMNYLNETGKYELRELGWFAPPEGFSDPETDPKWMTYRTDTSSYESHERDKYGKLSLPKVLADFDPDIVFTIGDEWMFAHATEWQDKWKYKTVCYTPIDGRPVPVEFMKTFENVDHLIAYGDWGANSIRQRNPSLNPDWVYHGVDLEAFKPLDKKKCKEEFGFGNKFVFGCFSRNQPRKQIPILLKAFALLVHEKRVCAETNKCYVSDPNFSYVNEFVYVDSDMPHAKANRIDPTVSPFTGGKTFPIDFGITPQNTCLYLHMALADVGWNLTEQIGRYGLQDYVATNKSLRIGKGISTTELGRLYNAMDVMALPTIAEGFGLTYLEAMACAVPILYTDYSAHTEWAGHGGLPIKVKAMYTEPRTNMERAIADAAHLFELLRDLYLNEDLRNKLGEGGLKKAQTMDWKKNICPKWEQIIDTALAAPRREQPKKNKAEIM